MLLSCLVMGAVSDERITLFPEVIIAQSIPVQRNISEFHILNMPQQAFDVFLFI